jgi:hypothetical protein
MHACLVCRHIGTFVLLAVLLAGAGIPHGASAADLSGWAWSGTIGWVKFRGLTQNGLEYGVSLDSSTGDLSGYAWSAGLGWLSFERATAGDPPQDDIGGGFGPLSRLDLAGGAVQGWARFLAVCADATCSTLRPDAGGWDGWVKLSGSWTNGVSRDPASPGDFLGFAWGNAVTGWLSFNSKGCDPDQNGVSRGDPGCPPPGTRIASYRVFFGRAIGFSASLEAVPDAGRRPLEDVDLIASVRNSTGGNLTYTFDCDRDDNSSPTFDVTTSDTTYRADDLCDYLLSGTYYATVDVVDENTGDVAGAQTRIDTFGFGEVRP